MMDAVSLVPCGHSLCRKCFNSNREKNLETGDKCFCKQTATTTIANYNVRDGVGKLRAICTYCKREDTVEALLEHIKECLERPLVCQECNKQMTRGQLQQHLCPHALLLCVCGHKVRRGMMETHQATICPAKQSMCPLECEAEMKR